MKLRLFNIVILGSCSILSHLGMAYAEGDLPVTEEDVQRLEDLSHDLTVSPIVRKALMQEQAFGQAAHLDLNRLLKAVSERFSDSLVFPTELRERIVARMKNDLQIIHHFNQMAKELKPDDFDGDITYSCKFNKLGVIIPEAIALVQDADHFQDLLGGMLPKGYPVKENSIRVLGGREGIDIRGTKKYLALNAALYTLLVEMQCEACSLSDIDWQPGANALLHSTPLGKVKDYLPRDFTYLYCDGSCDLGFVHGGYAFGGQRGDKERYGDNGKSFGPEDCSSWIAKLVGCRKEFSTKHLFLLTQDQKDLNPYHDEMHRTLKPLHVQSIQDIKPGHIFAPVSEKTKSGHVLLIVDVDYGNETYLTLEYNRDIDDFDLEGFGTRKKRFLPSVEGKHLLYFEAIADEVVLLKADL